MQWFTRDSALMQWAATGWAVVVYLTAQVGDWLHQFRFWADVWMVEGEEPNSHLPLTVLCAAPPTDRNYLLQQVFGENAYRQRRLGRYWLWNLDKAIAAAEGQCSLLLVQMSESQHRLTRLRDWFLIPAWVRGMVDLPRGAAALRKVNGDLRRIRKHGLQGEVTRDSRQFDDYYANMFVPYITNTFGKCAFVASYGGLRLRFLNSDLVLIKSGDASIAGQLIHYEKEMPCLWEIGIRDGDREHVKNGAQCALYHFGLQHLEQKGYSRASFGWSKPFLRDGVLIFKRKWGQRIDQGDSWFYGLKILSPTSALKAFLCNNPFIFQRDNLLYAGVFADADNPPTADQVRQIKADYLHAGLAGLDIHCLGDTGVTAIETLLPDEPSQRSASDDAQQATGHNVAVKPGHPTGS